jgi:threonine dehydrogenase-like Zn-dependent dehydrogenase
MKAVVAAAGHAELRDISRPEPAPGEALIRVSRAGICNTDVEVVNGYRDFHGVLGHEFVGLVEACPGGETWVGQRVVSEINLPCGHCDFCAQGVPSQCRNRTTMGIWQYDGAFAPYMTTKVQCLHALPNTVSDVEAVFVEPLAAACQLLELAHIRPRDRIVLLGPGKLGLLCAQVLTHAGYDLTVVVRRSRTRNLLERWGIRAASLDEVSLQSFTVAVECTGNEAGFEQAIQLVQPRGTIVLKSTYRAKPAIDLSRVVVNELALIGNRCGPFPMAIELLRRGAIDVRSMLDAEFPLNEAASAFDLAVQPGVLKVQLVMPNG